MTPTSSTSHQVQLTSSTTRQLASDIKDNRHQLTDINYNRRPTPSTSTPNTSTYSHRSPLSPLRSAEIIHACYHRWWPRWDEVRQPAARPMSVRRRSSLVSLSTTASPWQSTALRRQQTWPCTCGTLGSPLGAGVAVQIGAGPAQAVDRLLTFADRFVRNGSLQSIIAHCGNIPIWCVIPRCVRPLPRPL
jgi:hypothetical protein